MFYRPKFCCNCGEKVERSNWTLLSSRRFCEFCETENKPYDYLPRVIVGTAILIGLGGFASYFRSSSPTGLHGNDVRAEATSLKHGPISAENRTRADSTNNLQSTQPQTSVNSVASNSTPAKAENLKQRENPAKTSTEPVYYCGAMTKKGTPCTRRVKTKGRCWQHLGQPAMAGFEKLGAPNLPN